VRESPGSSDGIPQGQGGNVSDGIPARTLASHWWRGAQQGAGPITWATYWNSVREAEDTAVVASLLLTAWRITRVSLGYRWAAFRHALTGRVTQRVT
jgi:hypothetical protein